jgi:hypothetical protein
MINWNEVEKDLSKIMNKVFIKSTVEYIKSLIAKDFKLVVGGKVEFIGGSVHLGDDTEWEWTVKLTVLLDDKYRGKNIEIYIREE